MTGYGLRLDDAEVERYRTQARRGEQRDLGSWERAGIVPGARVADLGCGPGAVLAVLAARVGHDGHVVGVDSDPDAVARARTETEGLSQVEVRRGRADDTGLEPGTFDTVVLRLLLAHNGGAERAIVDHAVSLLRPGGCLWVFDVDMTLVRIQPPTEPLSEVYARYHAFQVARGNDDAVGLRLGDLLVAAGVELVEFEGSCTITRRTPGGGGPAWAARHAMVREGAATADEIERWASGLEALDRAVEQPRFFLFGFTAVGRRPPDPIRPEATSP